jgi:hypothetical protein
MKLQGAGGEPVKLQGGPGSHTRPARPPEVKLRRTAGGLHFLGGSGDKDEPPVATEIGA